LSIRATFVILNARQTNRVHRFEGFKASARLEAMLRVESIDFTFKTDPLETSSCDFAVMGFETNGKYYDASAREIGASRG